jgi:hypothetical protein
MGGDGLSVRGGAGGTTARLDDLDATAGRLCELGRDLVGACAVLADVASDPVLLLSTMRRPATGLAAEAAVLGTVAGPRGVGTCAAAATGLGVSLRAAVAAYRGADAVAAAALRGLAAGVAEAAPPMLAAMTVAMPVATLSSVAALVSHPPDLVGLLAAHPGTGDLAGAALPALVGGALGPAGRAAFGGPAATALDPAHQRQSAAVLGSAAAASPFLRESGRATARVGAPSLGRAPSGVAALVQRTAAQYPSQGGEPGSVRVERVQSRGGARSWIVMIPGTQSWSPHAGRNPFDLSADIAAVGGRPTAAGSVVVQGLRQCGARPGEPVLLVGHSLGGVVAAELAADRALRREVTITAVVTAGSPAGVSRVPDDVHVLSLEHSGDMVPWADGTQNPDRPTWVTVTADVGESVVEAHEPAGYVETARAVDASEDASLVRARQALSPFLDAEGVTSTSWVVTGDRVPDGDD